MKASKEAILSLLKKEKLLVLFVVGLLLLILLTPASDKEKKQEAAQPLSKEQIEESDYQDAYKKQLEKELKLLLQSVEGVGKTEVMITLAGTQESVVQEDSQKNSAKITEEDSTGGKRQTAEDEESRTAVMASENGNTSPFVIKENMPEIQGVIVVAEGGNNSEVVKNISEAIKALFGIEVHKIKVMKMNT